MIRGSRCLRLVSATRRTRYSCSIGGSFSSSAASVDPSLPYNHAHVERKWQEHWEKHQLFKAVRRPGHQKKYVLDMFPYPSGSGLHVGHPEGYTATDIMARYWRMKDYDVLHPMGWDAFGLPAEQYAIQTNTHPAVTTDKNIAVFKRQLKGLGFSYDWDREVSTTDPAYVRWTQWIFLQLFKEGLASQTDINVNWCPALGTVLANEEVIDGLSERGNHPVEKLPLRQWALHIPQYAKDLESDLDLVDWPEGTLAAQKQWIGRSEGTSILFSLCDQCTSSASDSIEVFTTRADTIFGVTYLVLAPEHPLVESFIANQNNRNPMTALSIETYVKNALAASDIERLSQSKGKVKTGVFTGEYASHPLTGEKIPIWIADYVLGSYGTGAVMSVPAHDARDFEFATAFNIPIRRVVKASVDDDDNASEDLPFLGEGYACNCPAISGDSDEQMLDLNGLTSSACAREVTRQVQERGSKGAVTIFKLRDWGFSRQRYWGEPIPIYFPVDLVDCSSSLEDADSIIRNPVDCANGGAAAISSTDPRYGAPHVIRYDLPIPVAEEDLPLTLPPMDDFSPSSGGGSSSDAQGCLARAVEWRYFQLEEGGQWFARETNTMPQWAGSSWYYLRFADPTNESACVGATAEQAWLPVDLYVGGQEHAVLHLLYARFWHKVLFKLGVVSTAEPFQKVVHQGMILGTDGEKMSKSRGNVINPDDIVTTYGADALRLYEMFMGPLEAVKPWQTSQVQGVVRFREKVFQLVKQNAAAAASTDGGEPSPPCPKLVELTRDMHKTIKKVTRDIDSMSFNTAISALMIYTNSLSAYKGPCPLPRALVENLVLLLSPIAPHCAEEFWEMLGHEQSLMYHPWPSFDESQCVETMQTVVIQVNGKKRGSIELEKVDLSQDTVLDMVLKDEKIKKFLTGKNIAKSIYVPGKIINIVVKPS